MPWLGGLIVEAEVKTSFLSLLGYDKNTKSQSKAPFYPIETTVRTKAVGPVLEPSKMQQEPGIDAVSLQAAAATAPPTGVTHEWKE